MWLRQSTASQEVLLGPFLDSTDGNTAETALTIANTDIKLWVEGATTEANKNSGGATHIASGRYYAVLDATDTGTLGKLEVNVHVTGALAVRREFMVVPAVVYDAIVLGTDNLDVNVAQWLGTAPATPTTAGIPEVDVTHVSGTAQTANDNGADINTLITNIGTITDLGGGASVGNNLVDIAGATFVTGTDSLEAIRNRGDAAWVTGSGSSVVRSGTAQAGAAGTITLDAGASATTDLYKLAEIYIDGGTGAGQTRAISAYNGTTKVATIGPDNWITTPDATSTFVITPSVVSVIDSTNPIDANIVEVGGVAEDLPTATALATAQADLDIITGADGAVLAATQPNSLSFQPITITAGDAINNITLAGTGTSDGIAFTRTGSGDPFDANFIGQINATVDTALTDYDAATGTELAATEAKIDIIDANVDLALADTNELQTDWVNGGRLDLILDARASQATADAIEVDTQDIQTKIGVPVTSVSVDISDVQTTANAIEVDTQDLQSRTPAALVGGRTDANVGAISGSAPAADNLEASALSIVVGLCEGTPSTTVIQTNLAETTDDHYIGRIVIFTTGAAAYQATDITDYTGATGTITVTALTTAPAATDSFVIL